jgi:hypothetical protein
VGGECGVALRSAASRPRRNRAGGARVRGSVPKQGRGPAADGWAPATVPGFKSPSRVKNGSHPFKFEFLARTNFDGSKNDLLGLQKFKIKYGFEDLEKINNFLHRNFFMLGRYFE